MRLHCGHCVIASLRFSSEYICSRSSRWHSWQRPSRAAATATPRSLATRWNSSRASSETRRRDLLALGGQALAAGGQLAALAFERRPRPACGALPPSEDLFFRLQLRGKGLRGLHLREDLVLAGADLPLHAFDLVEHRRVFLVRLDLHELALVLRPLRLEVLERAFFLAPVLLGAVEPGAHRVEAAPLGGQPRFQLGHLGRDQREVGVGAPELALHQLEADQSVEVRDHRRRAFYRESAGGVVGLEGLEPSTSRL